MNTALKFTVGTIAVIGVWQLFKHIFETYSIYAMMITAFIVSGLAFSAYLVGYGVTH